MSFISNDSLEYAVFDGKNVQLKFDFTSGTARTIQSTFSQLSVTVTDMSNPANEPLFFSISRYQLDEYLKETADAAPNYFMYSFEPVFDGKKSSSISIEAAERGTGTGADRPLKSLSLPIPVAPDAPKLAVGDSLTFGMDSDGTGVKILGGSLLITPSLNQSVISVRVTVRGTKTDGTGQTQDQDVTWSPTASDPCKSFSLPATFSQSYKPDTNIFITARSCTDNFFSGLSSSVVGKASIRLAAPVISSATSMQDRKITVYGTVMQAPYTVVPTTAAKVVKYSIFAMLRIKNQVVSAASLWQPTNIQNQVAPLLPNALANQEAVMFDHEVTQVDGVTLTLAKAYTFVAVSHYGDYVTKSLDIEASLNAPALTQSPVSNMDTTALTIKYVSDDPEHLLEWNTTNQSFDKPTNVLSFAPAFTGPFPLEQSLVFSYSFSKKSPSDAAPVVISNKTIQSHTTVAAPPPPFWDVSNPVKDTQYTLASTIQVFIADEDASLIESSNFALPIVSASNSRIKVVTLEDYSSTIKQKMLSSEVPGVKNLTLSTMQVGTGASARKALTASHVSPSDDEFAAAGCEFIHTEHQVIKGVSSTNPNDFVVGNLQSLSSSGATSTRTTGAAVANEDHPEHIIHQLHQGDTPVHPQQAELYSTRSRNVVLDKNSGVEVASEWSYDHHQVAEDHMNAATGVTIANYPTEKNDTLKVSFSVDRQNQLLNKPAAWAGKGAVVPDSFSVQILNKNGEVIGKTSRAFTALELLGYDGYSKTSTAPGTSPINTFALVSGLLLVENDVLRAKMQITYALKGSSSRKEGSVNDPNVSPYVVTPSFKVSSILVEQTPQTESSKALAPKAVDSSPAKITSIKVTAVLELNGLSPTAAGVDVKCYVAGALTGLVLVYNDVKKVYVGNLTPLVGSNYQSAIFTVVAVHPGSSNIVSCLSL